MKRAFSDIASLFPEGWQGLVRAISDCHDWENIAEKRMREKWNCSIYRESAQWQVLLDFLQSEKPDMLSTDLTYKSQYHLLPDILREGATSFIASHSHMLTTSQLAVTIKLIEGQSTLHNMDCSLGIIKQEYNRKVMEQKVTMENALAPSQKETLISSDDTSHRFNQSLGSFMHGQHENSRHLLMDDSLLCSQLLSQNSTHEEDNEASIQESIAKLKELWHSTSAPNIVPEYIQVFVHLSPSQMEEACDKLGLPNLGESEMCVACHQFQTLESQLCDSNVNIFASKCILPKVLSLSTNCSRLLLDGITSFTHVFPSAMISSVLIPVTLHENFGNAQVDLVMKILKETLNDDQRQLFYRDLITASPTWNNALMTLIHPFINNKQRIPEELTEHLVNQISSAIDRLADNLKFGKLFLALITIHGKEMSENHLDSLSSTANGLKIFLKKAILAAIKKLKN